MKSLRARCRARSPNRISFDKHSSFTDRTQRSANAFKFGLRGGRVMHLMPAVVNVARNDAQNFVSRSCRTYRTWRRSEERRVGKEGRSGWWRADGENMKWNIAR